MNSDHELLDLTDHDPWTTPKRREFPPQPKPLKLDTYSVYRDGKMTAELEATHLRLNNRGELVFFIGQRPISGFAAGGWDNWVLRQPVDDDGDATE